MREIKLYPSLLSADFGNLSKDVAAAEGCAYGLHCDIMDGHFVPNITFGPMVVKAVRRLTDMPLDVHLMIEKPEKYIEAFAEAGASAITVHVETCPHLHRTIQQIKATGVQAGVVLNPSTPVCAVEHVMGDIDLLLVMTVNPGFGGQSFIESMLPKIEQVRRIADDAGYDMDVAVDGGIDANTVKRVVNAGANMLIAGSSVYAASVPVAEACRAIIESAREAAAGR